MDTGMEKRLLLAIVLSTLVLGLFGYYFDRQRPSAPPPPPVVSSPPSSSTTPVPGTEARPSIPIPSPSAGAQVAKLNVYVDSSIYHAMVSNVGASLTSWQLTAYKADDQGLSSKTGANGRANFEMIPQYLPVDAYRPYSITTGDATLDREINSRPYEVKGTGPLTNETRLRAPTTLTFFYQRPGLYVEKTYNFRADNYILEVKPRVLVDGKERPCSLLLGPSVGGGLPQASDPRTVPHWVVRYGKKIDRKPGADLDKEYQYTDAHDFAGVEIQYFASVFLPSSNHEVRFQKFFYKDPGQNPKESVPNLVLAIFPVDAAPVATFLGPKEYDTLHKISPATADLIDYGWFSPIVRGMLIVLKTVYGYVHNYGIAIIILTFFLTLLLFPLRYKQLVSMKRMQKLQPRIKAIQEKYKKMKNMDAQQRQGMQKEIMEVYSQHGVNPLGGCLPMLPQLPIFFAFNSLLAYSIELHKAPFFGWIRDLSARDPYFVTPILMGLTMVIQQKLTPSTSGDPTQDKMMLIMPIFLTFIFINLSSGLTLYFLFSNIFGIILQKVSDRWIPSDPEGREGRPLKVSTVRR